MSCSRGWLGSVIAVNGFFDWFSRRRGGNEGLLGFLKRLLRWQGILLGGVETRQEENDKQQQWGGNSPHSRSSRLHGQRLMSEQRLVPRITLDSETLTKLPTPLPSPFQL